MFSRTGKILDQSSDQNKRLWLDKAGYKNNQKFSDCILQ